MAFRGVVCGIPTAVSDDPRYGVICASSFVFEIIEAASAGRSKMGLIADQVADRPEMIML